MTVGEYSNGRPQPEVRLRLHEDLQPYDNLARRAYPAILVTTSFNDSQVMYWEPAKYVARCAPLRRCESAAAQDQNGAAGHGASAAMTA